MAVWSRWRVFVESVVRMRSRRAHCASLLYESLPQFLREVDQDYQVRAPVRLACRIRAQNRRESFAVWRQVISAVHTEVGHARLRPHAESALREGMAVDGVLDRSNPVIGTQKE